MKTKHPYSSNVRSRTCLRICALLLLSCMLLGIVAGGYASLPAYAAGENLSLEKTQFEVGEAIMVTAKGTELDWVGIWPASDQIETVPNGAIYWYYIAQDGHTSGDTVHLQAQVDASEFRPEYRGLPAGEYQVLLCKNNTYEVLEKIYITIGTPTEPEPETDPPAYDWTLTTDKTQYDVGEAIYVTATGRGNDWVGLWAENDEIAPPDSGGAVCLYWYYIALDGNTSGNPYNIQSGYNNIEFRPDIAGLPDGRYKLAICPDDAYVPTVEIIITVGDPNKKPEKPTDPVGDERLTVSQGLYSKDDPIYVTATGDGDDWVGLYLSTDVVEPESGNMPAIYWYYINKEGHASGDTVNIREAEHSSDKRPTLVDIPAGTYKMVLCRDGGYVPECEVVFEVTDKNLNLYTDKEEYAEGEPIYVTAEGVGKDWVGIWAEDDLIGSGDGYDSAIYWYYIARDGNASGKPVHIQGAFSNAHLRPDEATLPAGRYKIALLPNNGYEVSELIYITVKSAGELPPKEPKFAQYILSGAGLGRADGVVHIVAADESQPTSFLLKWANINGPLAGVDDLGTVPYRGQSVTSFTVPEGTMIPDGADRILVWALRDTQTSFFPAAAIIVGDGTAETPPVESDTTVETTTPVPSDTTDAVEPTDTSDTIPVTSPTDETTPAASRGCASLVLPSVLFVLPLTCAFFWRRKIGDPSEHTTDIHE